MSPAIHKPFSLTPSYKSGYPFLHKILLPIFRNTYTDAIAVSKNAGDWLYRNNYSVLNNAIDTLKYAYNKEIRNKIRNDLDINNEFVIGNIGKLTYEKNQTFLLDIFAEYKKRNQFSKLLIGGGGEVEKELVEKAEKLGIREDVIFLGMLTNVEEILQAIDCFVFTSKYEGLGMVLIEAQASGLKCISSSAVPKETKVTSNIEYLDLDESINHWVDRIEVIQKGQTNRSYLSKDAIVSISKNGYYINDQVNALRNIYLN